MDFHEDHILPTVRIQKIIMENFKSVRYGEVLFSCGRKTIPQDTEADILGIYGQNGSGKTSVIEAIAMLERLMSGEKLSARYGECITKGADFAKLSFVFDFQYPKETVTTRTITYSFKIEAVPNDHKDVTDDFHSLSDYYVNRARVFDEVISVSGEIDGISQQKQNIITSTDTVYPIGPSRKIKEYVGEKKEDVLVDLLVNKRDASRTSRSFIFMDETLELFFQHSNYSSYFQILMELNWFAKRYLYAVDTRASGMAAAITMPFNTRHGVLFLNLLDATVLRQEVYEHLIYFINSINTVLPALISDMEIAVSNVPIKKKGKTSQEVKLYSKRKNTVIPLRDESAGIIKLICILSLIIAAFNDRSITVAIDELDAGIYEYLLGEILLGLQTYGKGQFVFTSHNLRPLEVLKKESIVFTTSNPENRYVRLKGVGKTNNLRKKYLDTILSNNKNEKMYDAAKRQRMIAAIMKAGKGFVKKK